MINKFFGVKTSIEVEANGRLLPRKYLLRCRYRAVRVEGKQERMTWVPQKVSWRRAWRFHAPDIVRL